MISSNSKPLRAEGGKIDRRSLPENEIADQAAAGRRLGQAEMAMGQPQYTETFQAGFDVFITSLLLVSGLSSGNLIIPWNRYGEAPI